MAKHGMLVLSRQRAESIVMDFSGMSDEELFALRGDPIEIMPTEIRGDKVRLGTIAPKCVAVHRREVWDDIRRENRAAHQVKPTQA